MKRTGLAVIGAIIMGCGGGNESEQAATMSEPAALTSKKPLAVRSPDASALFDWAERAYPELFPSHRTNAVAPPYVYRYYPETGNYVGLDSDRIAVLGPVSGGAIVVVGRLSDFACKVYESDCWAPTIATAPLPSTVAERATARFEVQATASPDPSYQWQLSTDGGATFTDIVGATGSSYTTPATITADDGKVFRVRVINAVGEVVSANAVLHVGPILTGVRNAYTFIATCPTSDPAYAVIRSDFEILNESVPFSGHITCTEPYTTNPIGQMSEELLTLQTLRLAYYMSIGTEGRLPWTSLSLYDWMKSQIAGINIVGAQGNSSCCLRLNGKKYITISRKPERTLDLFRSWKMLAGWLALFAHETRHAAAYSHTTGCPAFPLPTDPAGCDPTYDESNLGAYGIQRWLFSRWATGDLNVGLACGTPSDAMAEAVQMANIANLYRTQFVNNAPTDITAPTPYGGICYVP